MIDSPTTTWMSATKTPVARMQSVCLNSRGPNVAVHLVQSLIQWLKFNAQLLMSATRTHVSHQEVVHQLPMAIAVHVHRARLGIHTKLVASLKEVVPMVTRIVRIKVYVSVGGARTFVMIPVDNTDCNIRNRQAQCQCLQGFIPSPLDARRASETARVVKGILTVSEALLARVGSADIPAEVKIIV